VFKIHINNEEKLPDDDIFYIVAKEGIFLKKKLGIMESIAPVDKISILPSISSYAKMHITKIPSISFAKIVDFFRKVYKQYFGEAIVLLFYNEETGKYKIVPPYQKVSSAALKYNRGISFEGWTMIGTIHSHGSMSAFHSGTDHDDEETFDGLHITVGNVTREEFSLSASIIANGYRAMVTPEDYIDGIKKVSTVDTTEPSYSRKVYKFINGEFKLDEEASKKSFTNITRYSNGYVCLASPSKSSCNPKWLSVVEKITYERPKYNWSYGRYGSHYDPHAWYREGHLSTYNNLSGKKIPLNVKNQIIINGTKDPSEFSNTLTNNNIPCLTCKFREQKILLEQDEFSESLVFKCKKCGSILTEDDLTEYLECPKCKNGDYLETLDDSELNSNYQKMSDDQPNQEGFHVCSVCGTSFLRLEHDTECPFCRSSLDSPIDDLNEEESKCTSSEFVEYLKDKTEEIQNEFIKQASNPEPLLIPDKKEVQPTNNQTNINMVKHMFRKVFGKGYY
jgi:Zn finger protein HypA/HybF involved in hydrogenase expression